MPMSKAISDLEIAMEATRAELKEINQKISTLENERSGVAKRPPHTDDIAAVFLRGLTTFGAQFEQQMKSMLAADFVLGETAADAADPTKGSGRNILRIEGRKPTPAEVQDRAIRRELPPLNADALVYFLRDQIAAELPSLVDRLCPAAQRGIKSAERAEALAKLDDQIAALSSTRDQLLAELEAARGLLFRS